jgi:hypothetical protein
LDPSIDAAKISNLINRTLSHMHVRRAAEFDADSEYDITTHPVYRELVTTCSGSGLTAQQVRQEYTSMKQQIGLGHSGLRLSIDRVIAREGYLHRQWPS